MITGQDAPPFFGLNFESKTPYGTLFQYKLLRVTTEKIEIATGLTNPENVRFCFYFCDDQGDLYFKEGKIINQSSLANEGVLALQPIPIDTHALPFEKKSRLFFDVKRKELLLPAEKVREEIILNALKECLFAKKGFAIYVNHILAFIGRITHLSKKAFHNVEKGIFTEALEKIEANAQALDSLVVAFEDKKSLDINQARLWSLIESEIEAEKFSAALQTDEFMKYFVYIKELDEKLYYHGNLLFSLLS